jgi:hypothetical protein
MLQTLTSGTQVCRSALDICAPHARTERRLGTRHIGTSACAVAT